MVRAVRSTKRARRFLVADEVGLGKTVVAQQVIRRLMKGRGKPLVVFYVCSNLAIARQNRDKLLEVLEATSEQERCSARCEVDRLTLVPASDPPTHPRLHLYTLTPDTSVPLRKNRRRDGSRHERALIHVLVQKLWPELLNERGKDVFQRQATASWPRLIARKQPLAGDVGLCEAFRRSIREEMRLQPGQHLVPALRDLSELALIAHFRNALASAAIEHVAPDLIIFDEFQRFRDLLQAVDDPEDPATRLIMRLRGEKSDPQERPGLLLLSATPYRLYSRRSEDGHDTSHYREFFELIEFLYGGGERAKQKRKRAEEAFSSLAAHLRRGELDGPEVEATRKAIEKYLRPIMCRTERTSHPAGRASAGIERKLGALQPDDLRVFRHLAESLHEGHRSSAVHYWSSIPMPMQSMGREYQAWKKARPQGPQAADGVPRLSQTERDAWGRPARWPHARLRSLDEMMPTEQLALPWLAPSLPWWPLRNSWARQGGGKLLVFSRFRAVPKIVAALSSYGLEQQLLGNSGISYENLTKRRPFTVHLSLLGLFHPSPWLARHADPLAVGAREVEAIRTHLRERLINALSDLGVSIRGGKGKRPMAVLLGRIERKARVWESSYGVWCRVASDIGTSNDNEHGLVQLLRDWNTQCQEGLDELSDAELDALVDLALSGPGVVVARALARHWPGALSPSGLYQTLKCSWIGLRRYLDEQLFAAALRSQSDGGYPSALQAAVVDGNLEAVLDEHLWIIGRLRDLHGEAFAKYLTESMRLRATRFELHDIDSRDRKFFLRCHAILPFIDGHTDASQSDDGQAESFRPEELRRAFNTPFWPHVLVTTSVGQEGLDFHVWCRSLLHWDLCGNPVDLEQREGRIQRFGGLAVRRALALRLGDEALRIASGGSPWQSLAALAEEHHGDASGLCPWWVCEGAEIERFAFHVPGSAEKHKLRWLEEQRALYRLALGQPNQEDLVEFLRDRYSREASTIDLAPRLSPFFDDY